MDSRSISKSYDAFYYAHSCGLPYERSEEWLRFFNGVADRIVRSFRPSTVLDAGCAMGFLVEALHDRGVEAYGIDISEYAVKNARPDIRPYFWVGSITDPFPKNYDLIVCIEVLEHLSPVEGEEAIKNFCRHTSEILFSSTPFDYKEVTHLNVRPPDYWAEVFARYGFYRDVDFDATHISPWAARFRSSRDTTERIVAAYERRMWQLEKDNQARRELTLEQRNQLAEKDEAIKSLSAQVRENTQQLQSLMAQVERETAERERLSSELRDKEQQVQTLTPLVAQQEQRIKTLSAQSEEQSAEIKQLSAELAEKGSEVLGLSARIAEKKHIEQVLWKRASTKERGLMTTLSRLTDKENEVAHLQNQLAIRDDELGRFNNSLGGRLLRSYGRIKYRYLLPVYRLVGAAPKEAAPAQATPTAAEPSVKAVEPTTQAQWQPVLLSSQGAVPIPRPDTLEELNALYDLWARHCEAFRYNRELAARNIEKFSYRPLISIVMPVYNTPELYLRKAIDSVLSQYYPHWQLCLCDDASPAQYVRQLLEDYSRNDDRINVVFSQANGGIVSASNLALALATGEFVGLLDHDDELTPDALYEVARTLQEEGADLLYSDEDKLDLEGRRCDPFFKPAWSPDLLMSCNYVSHFGVYRRGLVEEAGGFREGYDGSQDYDLVLRVTERTDRIVHIPKVLYHWRKVPASAAASVGAKPYAYDAAKKALNDALTRRKIEAEVEFNKVTGYYRVKRKVSPGKVSIIIPTRDALEYLRGCIKSIETKSDYSNYEIIIVDNGSREQETLSYLEQTPHQVIRDDGPFNFSRLNNLAASEADGEYLLLLNNDVEVISTEWLRAMIEQAQRPEVGAVGAKLLYPDDRIQHAGTVLGIGGVASHSHKFVQAFKDNGYFNFPNVIRNYSAVTAACLMIRRELYNEVGGLNEHDLAVGFNDVDFCLRLRKRGYMVVYTPYALLYHHESATRGPAVNEQEISYMLTKWHDEITNDPYYNPNLSLMNEFFSVDFSKPESLYRIYAQDSSNEATGQIVEGKTIGQAFYATQNNLCAISIRFATYDYKCRGTVRVHVRHSPQSEHDIALVEMDALSIEDNEFHLCSFDPITDSGGRNLYFYVELVNHSSDSRLSIWKTSNTDGQVGPYFENHQPMQGTLSFRLYSAAQFRKLDPPG